MLRQQKNNLEKFKYNLDVRNFHIKLVLSSTSQLIIFFKSLSLLSEAKILLPTTALIKWFS